MHRSLVLLACVLFAVMLLSPRAVRGQSPESSVIGTGVLKIERQPQVMRLQVEITADGKTLQEALGTVVPLPSGCRYCLWAPRCRTSTKPSDSRILHTSRGLNGGIRPMPHATLIVCVTTNSPSICGSPSSRSISTTSRRFRLSSSSVAPCE